MKEKKKLIKLVERARKENNLETLNQAIDLNDTLGLLSKREEDIFTWGVVERWHKHQFSQRLQKSIKKTNGKPFISSEGDYVGWKYRVLDPMRSPKGVTKLEAEMFLDYLIDGDTYDDAMAEAELSKGKHWGASRKWIDDYQNQSEKEIAVLFENFKKIVEKESLLRLSYDPIPSFSRQGSLFEYTFWGKLIIEEVSL